MQESSCLAAALLSLMVLACGGVLEVAVEITPTTSVAVAATAVALATESDWQPYARRPIDGQEDV